MYIYTLFYKDTGLYNRSIFILPNDATAKKAMKLNLMDTKAEQFRNEAKLGNTELHKIAEFTEEHAISTNCLECESGEETICICNLKELLNDNNGNPEPVQ